MAFNFIIIYYVGGELVVTILINLFKFSQFVFMLRGDLEILLHNNAFKVNLQSFLF